MEIAEVRDEESLKAYLETLEGDAGLLTARRVAFRAAAQVLPLALRYFLSSYPLTVAPIFGALAIAGIASTRPTPPMDDRAASAAAQTANAAGAAAYADAADNAGAAEAYVAHAAAANAAAQAASAYAGAATVQAALAAAAAAGAAHAASASAAHLAVGGNDPAFWGEVRSDLKWCEEHPTEPLPALWLGLEVPGNTRESWENARQHMEAHVAGKWEFWILWYERIRAGRDFHADKLAEILNPLREDDWKKGPAHINPLFDDLLTLYREEDAALAVSDADISGHQSARQIRAVRAQVSTLKDYVESEFEFLRGQNQLEPGTEDEVDALVEILRQLRALVDEMLRTIDDESDVATALVAVENTLPAVVKKADALAEIEKEPRVSEVVLGMAASIKVLTESGTPGSLATGIAALDMVRQTAIGWLKRDRSKE